MLYNRWALPWKCCCFVTVCGLCGAVLFIIFSLTSAMYISYIGICYLSGRIGTMWWLSDLMERGQHHFRDRMEEMNDTLENIKEAWSGEEECDLWESLIPASHEILNTFLFFMAFYLILFVLIILKLLCWDPLSEAVCGRFYVLHQELKPGPACLICLSAKVDKIYLPCGHLACCSRCTSKLHLNGIFLVFNCPVCKTFVYRKKVARFSGTVFSTLGKKSKYYFDYFIISISVGLLYCCE